MAYKVNSIYNNENVIFSFESYDDLIEQIKQKYANMYISNIIYAGRDILKNPINDYLLNNHKIHIITVLKYTCEQFIDFLLDDNSYIKNICKYKPIATLSSGYPLNAFIYNWNNYNNDEKKYIIDKISNNLTKNNNDIIDFDIYIGNGIFNLFYSPKYIKLLADSSNKTVNELLELASNIVLDDDKENMDLIHIMFGDLYGKSPCPQSLKILSENSMEILTNYLIKING